MNLLGAEMTFLERVEQDAGLRDRIAILSGNLDLESVCILAAQTGASITPEALRKAWRVRHILRAAKANPASGQN